MTRTSADAAARVLSASRALVGVAARSLAKVESDLTLPQYRALVLLSGRGEMNARSLAMALEIKPSTLTGLGDRLVAKGLITRTPSHESRREVVLRISPRGRTLVNAVTERRKREIVRILDRLEGDVRRHVADAFEAFADAADELPDDRVEARLDVTGPARAWQSMRRHREQLSAFAQRSKEVLLLAAGLGAITGLVVGLFERVVVDGIDRVNAAPLWVGATMPFVGLAVAALCLRWIGRGISPATADEYLLAFHDPQHQLSLRALVARMLAAYRDARQRMPDGTRGPFSLWRRDPWRSFASSPAAPFSAQNRRVLLVAGAAAGVAAIFKAPATGAVFALEVPYQDDLARRMLLPALVVSASGYLTFVALHGTAPLLPVFGTAPFSTKDLVGAVIVGLLAGLEHASSRT